MVQRDEMRAADADREKVATVLRDAHADGRLTPDEFNDRLDAAYAARTYHDLDRLVTDLPLRDQNGQLVVGGVRRPLAAQQPAAVLKHKARRAVRGALNVGWWCYAVTLAICFVVWGSIELTADGQPPWPVWVAGPWGVVLGAAEIAYRRATSGRREQG